MKLIVPLSLGLIILLWACQRKSPPDNDLIISQDETPPVKISEDLHFNHFASELLGAKATCTPNSLNDYYLCVAQDPRAKNFDELIYTVLDSTKKVVKEPAHVFGEVVWHDAATIELRKYARVLRDKNSKVSGIESEFIKLNQPK